MDDPPLIPFPRYETLRRTVIARHDALIATYGVHHVGISKKLRRGRRLPLTCVTFYVMRKGDRHARALVPPRLDLVYLDSNARAQVATDVCEIRAEPKALAIKGGFELFAFDGEAGTVGLVLRTGGRDLFLTNAHAVTDPGIVPGPVHVVAPHTGGMVAGVVLRLDSLAGPVIVSDTALVQLPKGAVAPGHFRGVPLSLQAFDDIRNNDPRRFFFVARGFVFECRWLARVDTPAGIEVDGIAKAYAGFHKFAVTTGVVQPGISGAVVFCVSGKGLVACGLLFGGIAEVGEVWVFQVRNAMARMGLPT